MNANEALAYLRAQVEEAQQRHVEIASRTQGGECRCGAWEPCTTRRFGAALKVMAEALGMHQNDPDLAPPVYCDHCDQLWPCDEARALVSAAEALKGGTNGEK